MNPRDEDRILHILEAIALIERFKSEQASITYRPAVEREMEIITEACARLSDTFKADHPDIPWKDINAFRNLIAHQYWDTQWSLVEQYIVEDIPVLHELFASVLQASGIHIPVDSAIEPDHPDDTFAPHT